MSYTHLGDFLDGQWRIPQSPDGILERYNPAHRQQLVFQSPYQITAVDEAVAAAKRAQPAWEKLDFEARKHILHEFAKILTARKDDLAHVISREVGKPLWEASTEASALSSKIQIMSDEGWQYTATHRPQGLDGLIRHRPLGTLAVLGPFNFPLHLPNGHIIPGLLTGNTIVVKPSEMAPGAMQLYFECAQQAGFPPGVLNLVQGPGATGAKLAAHPDVDAVLFTGSYEVGLAIKRATIEQHWKLLALEMGGKNTCLVLDDADLERAAYEILQAAFLTTGQRCSATSRVVVQESRFEEFAQTLTKLAQRITFDDPFAVPEPFMGPLVNEKALEKFQRAQQDDEDGDLLNLLQARFDQPQGCDGFFASPAIWHAQTLNPRGSHQSQEIFGPDVVLYRAKDDEEAAHIANATEFGLAMSVFTTNPSRYKDLSFALDCGVLNLNRSTVGASSRLPFGGIKKSGNHRPSAISAGLYCTYPQAQLHLPPDFDKGALRSHPLDLLKKEEP